MQPISNARPDAPITRILRPLYAFAENRTSGGILLLLCTVAALVWANSAWAESYATLWHTNFTVSLAGRALSHDLHFWVNDLLMVIFFFVVGLEIKREILVGELATFRRAALPIVAAFGGVAVPALIYLAGNAGGPGAPGWGIPMATDIAFALGVMALLGDRVPLGLKVFLTALAIVDDIAAVMVIALFYTAQISWTAVGAAGLCLALLFTLNLLQARTPLVYAVGGVALWLAVLASGIHATIAGVALAMTIPSRTPLDSGQFLSVARRILQHFQESAEAAPGGIMTNDDGQAAVHALEEACEKVQPPLHRLEHALHPWVTFFIMPVFALANAGVVLSGEVVGTLTQPVALGVLLGLVLGKPIGITLFAWLSVRTGLASLPSEVTWNHIHGAGWLGGIGFTMSLFIASLAFTEDSLLTQAKLGILAASFCAAIIGSLLLMRKRQARIDA